MFNKELNTLAGFFKSEKVSLFEKIVFPVVFLGLAALPAYLANEFIFPLIGK